MPLDPGDDDVRDTAARIQANHPAWLVLWSPWRQQFTAFSTFAAVPMIVDDVDPGALMRAMRAEELRFTRPGR